ncbi:MAG: GNAT family N-acetyltransferase [Candidatus Latescibacteria bacterium]|nr:GNAT family N-acetyltransferase [Candidatus Latescibacterota bacterium]
MRERITVLQTGYLDECTRLFVEIFKGEPWREDWTWMEAKSRLGEILATPGYYGLVALDGPVVGFAAGYCETSYTGSVFYLKEMCVDSTRQRQGIGRHLLEVLQDRLARCGVVHMYLLTRRDEGAESFYAGAGFRTSQRTVLMSRNLTEVAGC